MKASIHLFRIAGIDIGIHFTWLFAFLLFAWTLADGFYPSYYESWSAGVYWGLGVLSSLLLFTSVLTHELAHSIVALRLGLRVKGITLFIFGGVSNMQGEAKRARDEFYVAVVGPATSLILAGIFWLIYLFAFKEASPLAALVFYLAFVNSLLGAFNLLPGFPLDGGRVLRSIIWAITGSVSKATNIASVVGQVFAFAFIGWGVFQIFAGDFLSGIWIIFIGWFLNTAADSSRKEVRLQEDFKNVLAKDLMNMHPEVTNPNAVLTDIVDNYFLRKGRRALPVCDQDGRLIGIVTLSDLKKVSQDKWPTLTVESIMTKDPLHTVGPNEDLSNVLKMLAEHDLNQIPVLEDGKLVGLLGRADMIRYLQARQELGLGKKTKSGR